MDSSVSSVEETKVQEPKRDEAFLAACVIYFIVLLAFVGLRIAGGLGWFDKIGDKSSDVLFTLLSQIVIMFAIPVFGMMLYRKKRSIDVPVGVKTVLGGFGFNKPSGRVVGYSFILGALLYLFNIFVAGICYIILLVFGYRFPVSGDYAFTGVVGFFITMLFVAVLPGLCEETAHRGLLLRGFVPKLGVMKAVLVTSIIFGLMHLNIVQCVYAAVLGYIIALAVLATRSIWTGVIMHFMNNGINVLFSYSAANNWDVGGLLESVSGFLSSMSFIIFVGFAFGAYCLMLVIINMFAKENFKKEKPDAVLPPLNLFKATPFYLNDGRKPLPMTALERTFFVGIILLGSVVTAMTFVWGML